VFLLAWLDWEAVGTGVSHSLKGAAEIVGVVTRADRREGRGGHLTSELVRRHFDAAATSSSWTPANEDAARVYERSVLTFRFDPRLH